jgi:hypothetical protein
LRKQVGVADQLVLFGSRSAGVARPDSDWDVLLVRADGPAIRCASKVDLVEIPKPQLNSSAWLGSELAGHIAAYGHWIVGEPTWSASVHFSKFAIERKGNRLKSRLQNMQPSWDILQPAYQKRFAMIVRRDVQRYRCLVEGRPVAPSSMLDSTWGVAEMEATFPLLCARLSKQAVQFLERVLLLPA